MNDTISIIIPCYNAAKTLKRPLESLLSQTYNDLDVIIINDSSTDDTLKIAEEYCKRDSRFRVFTQEKGGVAVARNLGLSLAKGDYIMFLDADDNYTTPFAIAKMLNTLKNKNADQVICNFTHPGFQRYTLEGEFDLRKKKDFVKFFQDFFMYGVPWNKVTKKACLTEKFIPGVAFAEDGLFNLANFHNLKKVVVLPDVLYNYYCAPYVPNQPASAINSMYIADKFWEKKSTIFFMGNKNQAYREYYMEKFHYDVKDKIQYSRIFDFFFFDLHIMVMNNVGEENMISFCLEAFKDEYFRKMVESKEKNTGLTFKRDYTLKDVERFIRCIDKGCRDAKTFGLYKNLICFSFFAYFLFNSPSKIKTEDILGECAQGLKEPLLNESKYALNLIKAFEY